MQYVRLEGTNEWDGQMRGDLVRHVPIQAPVPPASQHECTFRGLLPHQPLPFNKLLFYLSEASTSAQKQVDML
jgi:hypothetical protein